MADKAHLALETTNRHIFLAEGPAMRENNRSGAETHFNST